METNSSEPIHRLVFRVNKGKLKVSCYCRANPFKKGRGRDEYYDPIDTDPHESVFEAYNKSENHYAPFTSGDKINAS